jgi:hypothetical protein
LLLTGGHQERAIRAITTGRTTLISTGTGSGKTECFLYPVISRCLQLRDAKAVPGIRAVFVYPMNALAEDQLGRLRDLLAGTGITFGMYIGKTRERTADVAGERLPPGASRADYQAACARARQEGRETAVHPPEERVAREEMRTPGRQPRILLTNVNQLELLLTRQLDVDLFQGAQLEFLVFDEAHTYGGAVGAETACLIRRLRTFCGRAASRTVCVGTSATLMDPAQGPEAAQQFAARFFGVEAPDVDVIGEEYQPEEWPEERQLSPPLPDDPGTHLQEVLAAVDAGEDAGPHVAAAYAHMTGDALPVLHWDEALYTRLATNDLCFQLATALDQPVALASLAAQVSQQAGRPVPEAEVLCWLALGAAARGGGRPLLRPVVHAFVRGVGGAVVTFPLEMEGPRLWLSAEDEVGGEGDDTLWRLPVLTCNICGQHYFVHHVADLQVTPQGLQGGEAVDERRVWRALDATNGGTRVVLLDRLIGAEDGDDDPVHTQEVFVCRVCGAIHPHQVARCDTCGRESPLVRLLAVEQAPNNPGMLTSCLSCRTSGSQRGNQYREPARPVRAVTVSDVHVLAQNMIHHAERRRLLVFADNRQDAAFQAGWMRDHARRFRLRALMAEHIAQGPVSVGDLVAHLDVGLDADNTLSRALIPEVWVVARKEAAGVEHAEQRRRFLRILVLRELATGVKQRVGLEPWGRLCVEYLGLTPALPFMGVSHLLHGLLSRL